ncbi:MAG: hypothetical protein PUD79_04505 [Prevotellaceae bacterium]|nr:hypothetical protein [Prevotellaceae bacterium]
MKQDSEKNVGKSSFNPKDMVDKRIPCVYGPPEWYDRNGNLDDNHPSARRFKNRIQEIEERNRQRRMQRERETQDCDERIPNVYGPMAPSSTENSISEKKIDELVDMPTEDIYGPMPPITTIKDVIPKKKKTAEDIEKFVEEKRGFFGRLFGKKRKK